MKQENIKCDGEVVQELGNSMFNVMLDLRGEDHTVICTISGKIRKNFIRIMTGDRVTIEMSPYDLTRGRIVFRYPPTASRQVDSELINNKSNKKKK
jgi:translation initiation factor IF-1